MLIQGHRAWAGSLSVATQALTNVDVIPRLTKPSSLPFYCSVKGKRKATEMEGRKDLQRRRKRKKAEAMSRSRLLTAQAS